MSASASTSTNAPSLSPPVPSQPTNAASSSSTRQHNPSSSTSPSILPHSPETLRQIAEARTALEASMQNIGTSLSADLQSRAQNLHSNSAQLDKQMKDVEKGTTGLRKETEKLGKLAKEGEKKMKELGNVQNWAEMLERDFLVLGETLRLARKGSSSGSSWSGSEEGDMDGERDEESLAGDKRRELIGAGFGVGDEGRGFLDVYGLSEDVAMDGIETELESEGKATPVELADVVMGDVEPTYVDKGKGKAVETHAESIAKTGDTEAMIVDEENGQAFETPAEAVAAMSDAEPVVIDKGKGKAVDSSMQPTGEILVADLVVAVINKGDCKDIEANMESVITEPLKETPTVHLVETSEAESSLVPTPGSGSVSYPSSAMIQTPASSET